jgi:hypothetical protein
VAGSVKNRASGYWTTQHFFQANCLRSQLDVVVQLLPFGTVLELDGIYTGVWVKLDQVGDTDQVEPITPHRQSPFNPHARFDFVPRRIDKVMHCLPASCVDVVLERLLLMNQPALTRAVDPMLQGRERDFICGICHLKPSSILKTKN